MSVAGREGLRFRQVLLRGRGLCIGVRTNDAGLLKRVLAPGIPGTELAETGAPEHLFSVDARACGRGPRYVVRCGARDLVRTDCRREALDYLLGHMQITVAEAAREEVFVHAGVVGWNGRAIVLPGRSFSGKTSLVVELLRRGAAYYSDEYAVLDSCGRVHPYARPLEIRSRNGASVRTCSAESLGASVGSKPLEVALIVFANYKPHAAWRAQRVTPGNALLRLLANTVCARKRPHEAIRFLRRVALQSAAFCVRRGEGERAVGPVLELLERALR